MGASFSNYQVRTASAGAVAKKVRTLLPGRGSVLPARGGWVAACDEASLFLPAEELARVAREISVKCGAPVFAFRVHHSDVLEYVLHDAATRVDEYSSDPREPLAGRPAALLPYCPPGTDLAAVAAVLRRGLPKPFVFEEERLAALARLLGIDERLACAGLADLEDDAAEEILGDLRGARRVPGRRSAAAKRAEALIESVRKGDLEAVKRALAEGVDPNIPGSRPWETALDQAITVAAFIWKKPEIAEALLAAGARPSRFTLLAAASCAPQFIPALLAAGADLSAKNEAGGDALWNAVIGAAAGAGSVEGVRLLIEAGADVNARHDMSYTITMRPRVERGRTVLMEAARLGHTGVAKLLLASGADPSAKAPDGATPLALAAARGHAAVVALLREAGAKE